MVTFVWKQNKHHAKYQFLREKPPIGEPITAYTARFREKAKKCEFDEVKNERIQEHTVGDNYRDFLTRSLKNTTLYESFLKKMGFQLRFKVHLTPIFFSLK